MTLQSLNRKKIYHGPVNIGTQAALFAKELRNKGHVAIAVTIPDWLKRETDLEFKSRSTWPFSIFSSLWNYILRGWIFFHYDIFHFYFGLTLLPNQRDLKWYRIFGKKVVMEYLGNEVQGYQLSASKYKWTNMTHMMGAEEGVLYDQMIKDRLSHELPYLDKLLVCAPLYSEFVLGAEVIPLAVDLSAINFQEMPEFFGEFVIMHAPTNRGFKGTDYIIDVVHRLKEEGFQIRLNLVENVTHNELFNHYRACHLFIDQILAGWYGTASIEAMATGRPVIAFIRPEYFENIDYGADIPIINCNPDNLYDELKAALGKGIPYLQTLGKQGREFVEKTHCVKKQADRLVQIYQELI